MTLLEKARLNRRIALENAELNADNIFADRARTSRDIRPVLTLFAGGAARQQPSDFDPDLGMRLAA